MSKFLQADFSGGSNLLTDASRLQDNEVYLIINGRNRYGTVTSFLEPRFITDLPEGNYQGCYGAGNFLIVFISGLAYYRDFGTPNTVFHQVSNFSMNPDVDFIYTALVPASIMNFNRVPISSNKNSGVNLVSNISGSPQCLVCQDGINQPMLIFSDGHARVSSNYTQWNKDSNREYIPIGKYMLYHTGLGILFIISKDTNERYTIINRSISGRPLDFMVNIDINGDKALTENLGGAASISYRVDYDEITAITLVNSIDNSFYVSTIRNSFLVVPDFTNTLFGEPTFKNTFLFSTGAINHVSVIDVLGDTALIDFTGIKSFNAVAQFRVEGKNSPFSAKLSGLFNNILQSVNAAGNFDNYAFFSMDSVFGPVIVIYDTIRQTFVGIDQFSNLGVDFDNYPARIKQFAEIKTRIGRRFFFITTSNKLFEYFAGNNSAICTIFTSEKCSQDPGISLKCRGIHSVFSDIQTSNGEVTCNLFVDRIKVDSGTEDVSKSLTIPTPPILITPPFGNYSEESIENLDIEFPNSSQGWKFMLGISWNFVASLTHLEAEAEDIQADSALAQMASNYARNK